MWQMLEHRENEVHALLHHVPPFVCAALAIAVRFRLNTAVGLATSTFTPPCRRLSTAHDLSCVFANKLSTFEINAASHAPTSPLWSLEDGERHLHASADDPVAATGRTATLIGALSNPCRWRIDFDQLPVCVICCNSTAAASFRVLALARCCALASICACRSQPAGRFLICSLTPCDVRSCWVGRPDACCVAFATYRRGLRPERQVVAEAVLDWLLFTLAFRHSHQIRKTTTPMVTKARIASMALPPLLPARAHWGSRTGGDRRLRTRRRTRKAAPYFTLDSGPTSACEAVHCQRRAQTTEQ